MSLITATFAREQIPSLSGNGEDALLDTLIAAVSAAFARHCGYPPATWGSDPTMTATTYTRRLTGDGSRTLTLDVWPVLQKSDVTEVRVDPTLDFTDDIYLVDAAEYALVPDHPGQLQLLSTSTQGRWSRLPDAIQVICTAGYPVTAGVVDDSGLQQAAKWAVRSWYDSRKTQGVSQVTHDINTTQFRDEEILSPQVKQLLGRYRLPRVVL
ncbi:MAG: hypothetical protein AAFR76_01510 [Planctomycetota bacterium]